MKAGRYDFFNRDQDLPYLLVCGDCGVPVCGFAVEAHDRFHEKLEASREAREAA